MTRFDFLARKSFKNNESSIAFCIASKHKLMINNQNLNKLWQVVKMQML